MKKDNTEVSPQLPTDPQDLANRIRELDDLKNTFIALVSHELRTPLNLLAGYLDLGIEELGDNSGKALEYFLLVEENTKKLMRAVQELTDFTRIQRGKEIAYLDPIPLEDAFFQTYELLKPNLKKKNLNLVVDLPENVRILKFDGESLIILFRNLLSNAAKFSKVDGKVLVVGKIQGNQLSIKINDWASPIPESKRETIFEDFRQLENYLTRRYEGMGLGLAVARRTAKFLGGTIKLNVRQDGNTFEIILPVE
jgi:signal transduction histidine kinase